MLYGKCLVMKSKSTHGVDAVLAKAKEKAAEAAKSGSGAQDILSAAMSTLSGAAAGDSETEEDLETAWDCLEVARVISEKHDPESVKLSDVLVDIGDVSLESGVPERAVGDYTRALELRKKLLPLTDRRVAESYYMVGLAQSMIGDRLNEARDSFVMARRSLEERLAGLPKESKEVKELKQLIDDIAEKLEDLEAAASAPDPESIRSMMSSSAPEPKKEGETKPVVDLGVVGKSKREKPQSKDDLAPDAKKPKV